jgi:hypothetical protein
MPTASLLIRQSGTDGRESGHRSTGRPRDRGTRQLRRTAGRNGCSSRTIKKQSVHGDVIYAGESVARPRMQFIFSERLNLFFDLQRLSSFVELFLE